MESDVHHRAVLLGLAEVKAPLKKLTSGERVRIVHICYRKLLEIEKSDNLLEDEKLKCIGVVDSFYALQEVDFTITQSTCRLLRKTEVVLQYDLKDVIIVLPALDCASRIIIVSQTQSFGRTALVLQMQSRESAETLVGKISPNTSPPSRIPSNSKGKRGTNTLSKAMGRKVNSLLNSFGSSDRPLRDFGPTSTPENSPADSPEPSEEEDDLNADSESDDSPDLAPQIPVVIESLKTDQRPCFSKTSMSAQEAEIKHLIHSEASFVDALKRLIDFKLLLYDASNIIKRKHSDQMFMYVEELYSFHKRLLELLKSCENSVESVCSIFRENSDNFRYHVYYISNIPLADKIYNTYHETFKQTNSSLGEDLRKPRMRLNYYILTFESLKKSCSEECSIIPQIAKVLRAYLKEADTRLMTDSVKFCPFNLMGHGYLVISGELSLKKGEGLNKRRYQVLLLDDLLVLTKGTPDSSEYVTSFHLLDIELVHEMRGVLIHLNVKQNKKTLLLIFKARTIKLQQKWIENLRTRIDIVKEIERKGNFDCRRKNEKERDNDQTWTSSTTEHIYSLNVSLPVNSLIPPLTIEMAFPKFLGLKLKGYEGTTLLYTTDVQESERFLIKSMDHFINQSRFENNNPDEFSDDVKLMYEFHLRYFYPALTYDKESFEKHVCRSILNKRNTFVEASSLVLYKAAVLKYETQNQNLPPVFDAAVNNSFKYMDYFSQTEFINETKKWKIKTTEVSRVFEEVLTSVNLNLKQKYISDFPFNEPIVMEGNLAVCESLEQTDQDKYVILTEDNTHILSYTKTKVCIEVSLKNKTAKLGHPPGIKSFQIKFLTKNKHKKKYNFTASSIETKSKWISSFHKVLPQEFRRKELIRISGRLRPRSVNVPSIDSLTPEISDCFTGTECSLTAIRRTSDTVMMESKL